MTQQRIAIANDTGSLAPATVNAQEDAHQRSSITGKFTCVERTLLAAALKLDFGYSVNVQKRPDGEQASRPF